jgi:hypothetical protein
MPFFRTAGKIVYFAHVPKCGGTSVENYLTERFGPLAMLDRRFQSGDPAMRWSRTSPQHIDWRSLRTILPPDYIDAVFTMVRHPIARAESAYHFQIGVEKTVAPETPFSDWLADQVARLERDPFALDNHMRPQTDFVPEGAAVFHLEHGPDALIPYLDGLAGGADGPRAIGHSNKRASGAQKAAPPPHQIPGPADLAQLVEIYGADFERFGYTPEDRAPQAARPVLDEGFKLARDRERARRDGLAWKLRAKAQRWLDRP